MMNSPPASLEPQRTQRGFSFNFLLRGQKVKNTRASDNRIAILLQAATDRENIAFESS